jgi:non-heme chloroperoxidase
LRSSHFWRGRGVILGWFVPAFAMLGAEARLDAQQEDSSGFAPKLVRVRGADMSYFDLGSGDPVIFVHGSLGDLETFKPQFEAFAAQDRVVAYSRRFHPPNPLPAGDSIYSAAQHAADLAGLIDELRLTNPRIVSLSYGAYTAVLLALGHPDRIRALVLAEPPLLPLLKTVPGGDSLAAAWQHQVLTPAQEAFRRGEDEQGLRVFVGGLRGAGFFDELSAERQEQLRRYTRVLRLQMLTSMELYFPGVSCADLRKIRTPILLIGGDHSPSMFRPILDELARCLPNAERVVIPGAGHNMQVDNPLAFNEQVLAFLHKH